MLYLYNQITLIISMNLVIEFQTVSYWKYHDVIIAICEERQPFHTSSSKKNSKTVSRLIKSVLFESFRPYRRCLETSQLKFSTPIRNQFQNFKTNFASWIRLTNYVIHKYILFQQRPTFLNVLRDPHLFNTHITLLLTVKILESGVALWE